MKNKSIKMCTRCVMDETAKDISFDKNGVCNYCKEALERKDKIVFKGKTGKEKWDNLIKQLKSQKNVKYHCIVGISGGIDSSYLAYLLSKEGLKILGVHVDAGWNTDISNQNIKLLCEKCGIDLKIVKVDEKEMMDLQRAYFLSNVINQDVPQDHMFFSNLYFYAIKNKIKYFISGGNWNSESITPKCWIYDAYDSVNIKDIHKKYGTVKLRHIKLLSFFKKKVLIPYFYKIKRIDPLNFVDYNPNEAIKVLEKEIGFKYYGSKHCESVFTRLLQCYIQPKKYGFEKRRAHLSSMIISGLISREDALKELQKDPCTKKQVEEDIKVFTKKIGISRKEFDEIINNNIINSHYSFRTDSKKKKIFNSIKNIFKRR